MNLLRYIQGFRKGKEAHRIEKEAMQDPFLADAIEGFDQVQGNHIQEIEKLRKKITIRTQSKRSYYIRNWSIAASILFCIGIGGYFLVKENELPEILYTEEIKELFPLSEPSAPAETIVAQAKQKEEKEESVALPPPAPAPVAPVKEKPMAAAALLEDSTIEAMILSDDATYEAEIIQEEQVQEIRQQSVSLSKAATISQVQPMVKGKVVDREGEPIIGASILQQGTTRGTVTDLDGHFELPVNDTNPISVQFIGYEPVDIPADTSQLMLIAMNDNQEALEEMVVVGYGRQKKKNKPQRSAEKEKASTQPQPVIGKRAFRKYLSENLIPPTDSECSGIKGKVIISFLVNEKRRPYNFQVKTSLCPSADKEAIRLIEKGPDWTVGVGSTSVEVIF